MDRQERLEAARAEIKVAQMATQPVYVWRMDISPEDERNLRRVMVFDNPIPIYFRVNDGGYGKPQPINLN